MNLWCCFQFEWSKPGLYSNTMFHSIYVIYIYYLSYQSWSFNAHFNFNFECLILYGTIFYIFRFFSSIFLYIWYFVFVYRVMMFIVGLPVAQIVLFCLSVGKDPYGLHLAIVNHETNNKTCPPTGSCDLTQLSCQFLHQIEIRRQILVSNTISNTKLKIFNY